MEISEITRRVAARVAAAPDAAAGVLSGKVILFDFGAAGRLRIDGRSTPFAVDNADGAADCLLQLSMADFIDIASGRRSAQTAYLTGKLAIRGDLVTVRRLSALFG